VNELLDRHLAMLHCGEHTRESYEYLAARHIRPVLGRLRLLAATAERLDGLHAQLLRCREHCPARVEAGHVCRPLHPGTVRKIHYLLHGAFRRAMRWRWIDHSPTSEASAPPTPYPQPKPPTPAEAARIVTEAWQDPDLGPLVWLAMATGARRGELCALRWRHIDTTRGVVVIQSAIAQSSGKVWEKDTKLHLRRHIALDPLSIAIVDAYRQHRRERAAAVGIELPPDGFVFSPRADARTCPSPQSLTDQYRRLVGRLGIRTSLHKVRQADQRASRVLMDRLPFPAPPSVTVMATRPARPLSPYRAIAAQWRTAILNGTLPAGATLPTVKELAARHHVAPSTIHRATALLAAEHLIAVSRGRRAISTPPPTPPNDTDQQPDPDRPEHCLRPEPDTPRPGGEHRPAGWFVWRAGGFAARANGWRNRPHIVGSWVAVRGMARGMKPRQIRGLVSARVPPVVANDAGDGP
jgi:integrase/DNA-binding transcriptional regulator YhcF (GntR family)